MAVAITFENVSKQYRLGLVSTKTISHDLNRWWQTSVLGKEDPYLKIGEVNDRSKKGTSEYVWALRDINFDVQQGDVLGIIGKNGAGKSTLLKILSRITTPTTGSIKARGRIASLLEVGTGFHPELTGRENIYMNGAIMGMTKSEITRKLDEIVDFSGVERYLDTPVKRYSSGMTVRLGFAIAAHLDPEILVVDEVLAVGDAEFQKKAIGKMQDVSKGEGRTVLFVSHNMAAVKNLCKTGVVLKDGFVEYMGTAEDSVDYYIGNNISELISEVVISDKKHRRGFASWLTKDLEYKKAELLNNVGAMATDESIKLKLTLHRNNVNIREFQAGLLINNESAQRVGTFTSSMISIPNDAVDFEILMELPNHNLGKGKFFLDFNMGIKDLSLGIRDYDVIKNVLSFEIKYQFKDKKREYVHWNKDWGSCCFNDGIVKII